MNPQTSSVSGSMFAVRAAAGHRSIEHAQSLSPSHGEVTLNRNSPASAAVIAPTA